jgi:hypothetical protein
MSQSIHAVCPHCSAVNRIPADRPASEAKCGSCKTNLFTGEPIVLTSKTFDKHVERNDMPRYGIRGIPTLIAFGAARPVRQDQRRRGAGELFGRLVEDWRHRPARPHHGAQKSTMSERGKVAKQHAGLVDLDFLRGLAR